jgi:hypothetical protein
MRAMKMTKLATGQSARDASGAEPLTPVAFNVNGLDFAWIPPTVPLPWDGKEP